MPKFLRRSALYMPASNRRALDKARSLPADMILMDLEDSVVPEVKAEARTAAAEAINKGGYGHREVVLRINAPTTEFWKDDLNALENCQPDGVLVPKVNSANDIAFINTALDLIDPEKKLALWVMMETPLSVLNAQSIGQTVDQFPRLQGFVIGTNDLVKDTGVSPGEGRAHLLPWLMTFVAAAKAANLTVLDGVCNDFRNPDGILRECRQGRELGMNGKTLIHPNQIKPCNQAFSPNEAEISAARLIVNAFNDPAAKGKGVIDVEGEMVERLHLEIALATLICAESIARSEDQ